MLPPLPPFLPLPLRLPLELPSVHVRTGDIVDFPDVFCQDCRRESSRLSTPPQLPCARVRQSSPNRGSTTFQDFFLEMV